MVFADRHFPFDGGVDLAEQRGRVAASSFAIEFARERAQQRGRLGEAAGQQLEGVVAGRGELVQLVPRAGAERLGERLRGRHLDDGVGGERELRVRARDVEVVDGVGEGSRSRSSRRCRRATAICVRRRSRARRLAPPTGFVRIGVGRDAADTSFATIYGLAEMTAMRVYIEPDKNVEARTEQLPEFTTSAVALP